MINRFATTFETRECKDQQERLFAGESVDLVASMTRDGVPLSLSGCTARGIYQPESKKGTGDFYGVPAEIVGDTAVVHWTADREGGGNTKYRVWALVEGGENNVAYPCSWTLSVAYSPSYHVGELPDPIPETIDFSKYTLVNDPWLRVTHLSAGHDEVPQDVDFTGAVTMDGVIIDDMDLKEAVEGIESAIGTPPTGKSLVSLIGTPSSSRTLASVVDDIADSCMDIDSKIGTPPTGKSLTSLIGNTAATTGGDYVDIAELCAAVNDGVGEVMNWIGTPPTGLTLASLIGDAAASSGGVFADLAEVGVAANYSAEEAVNRIGNLPTGKTLASLIGNTDAESTGAFGDLAGLGVGVKEVVDDIATWIGIPPTGKNLVTLIGTDPESMNRSVQVAVNDARAELIDYFDDIAARIGTPPSSRTLVSMVSDVADSCTDIDSTTRGTGAKIDNQTYGLAAIRSAIDALAAALPSQVSVVPYVTDNTLTLRLGTVVYRMNPTGTSISIPSPVMTALPATDGYYQFEIELAVPATATSLTAPSGWTWLTGFELPSSGYAGKTVFVSCRMDCRTKAVTASCWRVA